MKYMSMQQYILTNITTSSSPAQNAGFWAEPFLLDIVFLTDSGSQGYPFKESAWCRAGTLGQFEILTHLCHPPWYIKWTNWAFSGVG